MAQTLPLTSSPTTSTESPPLPATFGKYKVLSLLGSGGFGSVYRCRDEALNRDVAIKALAPSLNEDHDIRERFQREARALASVNHPCVVQVFDVGETPMGPFFVMELVAGKDLERVTREGGPLPELRALQLIRQAVTGLKAASAAGVVHRDIKPANLLVSGAPPSETLKVTDFGLAFPQSDGGARLTAPTTILGTPEYMAPEQARGDEVDERADMYSLGCSLYEMLTGAPPFVTSSPQATVASQLTQTPDPVRVRRPELSVATNTLIMRLLAKDRTGRFANYDELITAIDGAMGAVPGGSLSGVGLAAIAPPPPSGTVSLRGEAVQTENLALCFVDLVDFQDRTRQQTREENAEWTGVFSDGMKRLIRQRGGRFIKQVYGQVLCAFVSPTDAVLFGMAAIDSAWEWSRNKQPIMTYSLRVGINLGEVRVERGDVFGDPVNVAARVMALSEPGHVLFSDAVYLSMSKVEVQAEFVGLKELKGVPVPVRIFKALPVKGYTPGEGRPPFGAKTLAGGVEALEKLDARARAAVSAVGKAAGGAARVGSAFHPVVNAARAAWEKVPQAHRTKVALGVPAAVLLVVLVVFLPRWMDPYRREVELLDDGKAGAAARLLETRSAESPRAQWLYAKALTLSGKRAEGLAQLEEALTRDASLANAETLEMLLAGLQLKERTAVKLILKHYGDKAETPLRERTTHERFYVRHHAANALREMGREEGIDWAAVWLKDIRFESECSRRRDAVRALEEIGDVRALSAIQSAKSDPGGDPGCVGEMLAATERRMKKKLGQ